jgi:hypothetical protein
MGRQTQTYLNTLIFSIVTGLFTLMLLLALLFSSSFNQYAYAIVTVEVGLIAIITHALYKIIAYENRLTKLSRNATKNALVAQSCPDYYTVGYDASGALTCKNYFEGRSPSGERFVMFYVPGDQFTEKIVSGKRSFTFFGNPPASVINVKDFENKRIDDTCKVVQGRPPESDEKMTEANNYTVPWTDMRPKCDGFSY